MNTLLLLIIIKNELCAKISIFLFWPRQGKLLKEELMINRNRNLLSLVIVIVSVLCIGSSVFAGSYTKSFTYALKNVDPIWFSDKSYGVTEILSVKNTSAGTVERTLTCNLTVTDQSNDHKEYSNQTVTFGAN